MDNDNLNSSQEVDPVDNIDEEEEDDDDCEILMSMCGEFLNKDYIINNKLTIEQMDQYFTQYHIQFDQYSKAPKEILKNKNLVICI